MPKKYANILNAKLKQISFADETNKNTVQKWVQSQQITNSRYIKKNEKNAHAKYIKL